MRIPKFINFINYFTSFLYGRRSKPIIIIITFKKFVVESFQFSPAIIFNSKGYKKLCKSNVSRKIV